MERRPTRSPSHTIEEVWGGECSGSADDAESSVWWEWYDRPTSTARRSLRSYVGYFVYRALVSLITTWREVPSFNLIHTMAPSGNLSPDLENR